MFIVSVAGYLINSSLRSHGGISSSKCLKNLIRTVSRSHSGSAAKCKREEFVPFMEMVGARRKEAQRSILVQVQSAQSAKELHSYCASFGQVRNMLHYTAGTESMHFIIVEFAHEAHVQSILSVSSYPQDASVVPVHSNFLWFKAANRKIKLKQAEASIPLTTKNGNKLPQDAEVKQTLKECQNISDQMQTLYDCTKLNDLAVRLRFLTARQVELAMKGLFDGAIAYPFGSSVNGCGKMGCDLDLVLRLSREEQKESDDGRLVFHCKAVNGYERSISQRHMDCVGDMIHLFLPGCSQVRKILQARVPIIKYYQQLTDVECDLSMSNMSGVCMSDLLYMFGSIDDRVRPLIFTIRKWAQQIGLTNSSPGRWITNFSLTMLVLAFLQRNNSSTPILPSINTLFSKAGPKDRYVTEDGVDCSFQRNIHNLDFPTSPTTDSLESLLKQFCEYYAVFDFSMHAVCLNEPLNLRKPDHSALYIVNPLERGLNVSKNVSLEELEKFRYELRNVLWLLESAGENWGESWGITAMFERKTKFAGGGSVLPVKTGRLVQINSLFEKQEGNEMEEKAYTKPAARRKSRR